MVNHFFKIIGGCCSGGFIALGIYNALLLVEYFRGGRGMGMSFLNARQFLCDLAVFAAVTVILIAADLVLYSVRGGKDPDGDL